MKVLVATNATQGRRAGDFMWTVEGELVSPLGSDCCEPDRCGCGRSFSGLASSKATTTALVAELPITEAELRAAAHDSLEREGWLGGASPEEADELVDETVEAIHDVCAAFAVGAILEREGDLVRQRAQIIGRAP